MPIKNLAGYKFVLLNNLEALREDLFARCDELHLKGTILLSEEGINLNLAGKPHQIDQFILFLQQDSRFQSIHFKFSDSDLIPFKRLKVKLKKEIITLKQPTASPLKGLAPSLSPEELKRWLDEQRDITILDTRNEYEIEHGSFKNAVNLHLNDFCEFPSAIAQVDTTKPIVMFCTGGIRCEKAALYMMNQGVKEVYQLEGGILNYFNTVGGAHYEGACFVFDERVALSPPDSL